MGPGRNLIALRESEFPSTANLFKSWRAGWLQRSAICGTVCHERRHRESHGWALNFTSLPDTTTPWMVLSRCAAPGHQGDAEPDPVLSALALGCFLSRARTVLRRSTRMNPACWKHVLSRPQTPSLYHVHSSHGRLLAVARLYRFASRQSRWIHARSPLPRPQKARLLLLPLGLNLFIGTWQVLRGLALTIVEICVIHGSSRGALLS